MNNDATFSDISEFGTELTDDELTVFSGGLRRAGYSKTLDLSIGICDVDEGF